MKLITQLGGTFVAENKQKQIRRTPSLKDAAKQMDQALSSANDAPKMGKIQVPPKPAEAKNVQDDAKTGAAAGKGQAQNRRPNNNRRRPQAAQNAAAGEKPAQAKPAAQPKQPRQQRQNPPRQSQKGQPRAQTLPKENAPANSISRQPAEKRQNGGRRNSKKPAIRAYFLGGLNEIGKNFTVFECQDDMIILDCGLAFPDEGMLGIDIVIPDFTFVEKNLDKIRGIVITHGHEDHIGALPYLLKRFNVPVYGTALTIGLIAGKLKEHNLTKSAKLQVAPAGSHIHLGCMDVELIHVNHSISDAVGIAIHSPAGTLVHTGDFKIDFTPAEGSMIDLARFAELGNEGVLALMADSTNAERPGYTQTEQLVNNSLDGLFAKADGQRIIIATFASNISRVQMIINCAVKYKRKVALSGRSMLNVMGIASELGYLNIPKGILIDLNTINRYSSGEIVLITTGSQGEPMSALTRMAFADHRQVELHAGDFIILSARPIPGNDKAVGAVVDELLRRDCTVIYESMYDVHVSGHACQEELKIIQALVKPKYFIPVHGEQKHLRKNAAIAKSLGMPEGNIFIGEVGNALEIQENYMKKVGDVPAGAIMVDGLGVGDVGSVVLRDRKHLGEDGIIIAVCTIEAQTGRVASGPDIVSRGFVYVKENEKLMDEARELVYNTLEDCAKGGVREWNNLKLSVRDALSHFLYKRTKRSPMILPIIMEV